MGVTTHFDKNNLIQAAKYTPAPILQDKIQILTNYAIFDTRKEAGDTGNLDRESKVDKSFMHGHSFLLKQNISDFH